MYIVIIKLQNCPFCAIVISLTFFTHITILYYSHVFMSCPFCLFISLHVFFSTATNTRTHVLFSGGHRNFINATCGFFSFFPFYICICHKKISLKAQAHTGKIFASTAQSVINVINSFLTSSSSALLFSLQIPFLPYT